MSQSYCYLIGPLYEHIQDKSSSANNIEMKHYRVTITLVLQYDTILKRSAQVNMTFYANVRSNGIKCRVSITVFGVNVQL